MPDGLRSPAELAASDFRWPEAGPSRVPFRVYADEPLYRRELERLFYGPHWSYVGLEVEIPNVGDFKRSVVGERPVIVLRGNDGGIAVVENRCAHRGVKLCQQDFGTAKELTCPYHQWTYTLSGDLIGVPFRRGVKKQGGMPADFRLEEHGLRKLKVAARHGVVFACFDQSAPSFEDYLGPLMLGYFDRVFDGRKLRLLGYSRQRIPANWKLMQENIKDPYHASLLHVFFVTFGLFRADQKAAIEMDETGRHCVMSSRKGEKERNEANADIKQFREGLTLQDDRIMDVVHEWKTEQTVAMQTIFPSLVIQQQINSLSTRHIQPKGPHCFDYVWTHFGYADDSEEMTRRRLRQANLFGPAGFVSADDGEVVGMSQDGLAAFPEADCVVELGGRGTENTPHMVTETAIRAMYRYYREVMEL
jgi:salicylate 5-hydroxylase large subunit